MPRLGSCPMLICDTLSTLSRCYWDLTTRTIDMLNRQHTLHGGCTAFLVDVWVFPFESRAPIADVSATSGSRTDRFLRARRCSSVGLAFLGMVQGRPSDFVSQTIVTTFHAPAPLSVPFPLLLLSPSWPCNAQAIRVLMLTAPFRAFI